MPACQKIRQRSDFQHGQDKQGISAKPDDPFNCTELSGKNNLRPDES
jgi:hypothetical protein